MTDTNSSILNAAKNALSRRDYISAQSLVNDYVQTTPVVKDIILLLAETAEGLGEKSKAEAYRSVFSIPQTQRIETKSSQPTKVVETNATLAPLLSQVKEMLDRGNTRDALSMIIDLKRRNTPTEGLDYLRAVCFAAMDKLGDAREALKEELRYFPNNEDAEKMLASIAMRDNGMRPYHTGDVEFERLCEKIRPYTMVPGPRLWALYTLARTVCERDIAGDFIECGVAAGGTSVLLAYVIKNYSKQPRTLYSCDTFTGMPKPTDADRHGGVWADDTGWGSGTCAAPEEALMSLAREVGVADVIQPVKGLFQETLPGLKSTVPGFSFIHLDGDWYESTLTILENLYEKVSKGGLLQIDDYGHWEGCKKAVHEFFENKMIPATLRNIDGSGIWLEA